jgi:lysophospholipase L1-like esterase/ubiquinone/menaquinone biosynthesis C-methylase UbiE
MNNLNLVFFGDSITYGQYIDINQRWTTLLEQRINNSNSAKHNFINKSITGETTTQGLIRFASDVQNNNPDILCILFGINDCNFWETDNGLSRVSPQLYKQNIKEMIFRGFKFGAKKIILLTNHITMRTKILLGGISLEENRKHYNNIIREISEEENVILIDIEKEFNKLSNNEIEEMNLPDPDLLHLSIKGHLFFADIIEPILKTSIENINKINNKINSNTLNKSNTDIFWNERIFNENDYKKVNISDLTQRQIENDFIFKHLLKTDNVLEVGCGNGFITNNISELVNSVDAFDYAENMIEQAKIYHQKDNVNFFWDNILEPSIINNQYDVIVCIRVLINLRNFEEQEKALNNMYKMLKPSGKLILIEGFIEGFEEINNIRKKINLKTLSPAKINYYSKLSEFSKLFENKFNILDRFNTGMFDYLTRIVYPSLVGEENASGYSTFHKKILPITQIYKDNYFVELARLHGYLLNKQ